MALENARKGSLVLIYGGLLVLGVASLGLMRWFAVSNLLPTSAPVVRAVPSGSQDSTTHLLRALISLILASTLFAALCRAIRQPPVIGEILAGICLGPSIAGRIAPSIQRLLVPPDALPQLGTLSQIGIILFMFLVGLELDTSVLRTHSRSTVAISHASIVVPFVLGTCLARWLYPSLAPPTASFTVFALFLGVSLSVTAFPVLARILTDNDLNRSSMGVLALTCAAVDDVTAWCLLAVVVGVAKADTTAAVMTCGASLAYVLAAVWFVRPAVARWVKREERTVRLGLTVVRTVVVVLLASALITENIGIHAIFGAFLLGAVIPHDSRVALALAGKVNDLVVVLFMPAFYALTGMRTQLGLLGGWHECLVCGVIILVACIGKFGGSYVAARMVGLKHRESSALGILMNTRGLMELVVLGIGLDLGVISPTLFAMMVVMALTTTVMTAPLLRWTHAFTGANGENEPTAPFRVAPLAQIE